MAFSGNGSGSNLGINSDALLCDFMVKRSQNKSRLTVSINYKSRWFVLCPDVLRYCDGSLHGGVGKEKNHVNLSTVLAVEEVEDMVLKPNTFQIVYKDPGNLSRFTLYVIAGSAEKRKEWIDTLRTACDKCSVSWEEMYHPGVWLNGNFSCCDQRDKKAPGCRPTFVEKQAQKSISANGISAGAAAISPVKPAAPLPSLPVVPKKAQPPAPKKEKKTYTVIALYHFQRAESGDLSLVEGEELEILDDSRSNWWLAKNRRGEKGYIPANYIQKVTKSGLERQPWYIQGISRAEAEGMLREDGSEGCFLVRESSQKGRFTLSVYTKEAASRDGRSGVIRHYHIKETSEGQYFLSEKHSFLNIPELITYHNYNSADAGKDVLHYHINFDGNVHYISQKHVFNSIPEMINYHKHNSAGLVVRLRSPPRNLNRNQPATAGFGHDKWEIDPSELEIGGVLGKGQFGEVRKAKWQHRIDVAVKTMQEGAMSEQDFIDEAKTMKQLQHKNLVQLYGVCTKRRPIYIVTEYMRHGSLLNYLKRHKGKLLREPDKLLSMCVQVACGMEYLESQGFIHRDLAARNCLVGENNLVKVADFGLARFVLDDQYTSSLGAKFPIKWAPPEVLGYSRFSSKSDVWSFGILVWEVFTGGEMPYGNKKNPQVVEDVTRGYRLQKPSHCHECIYIIMALCWDNNADYRPAFKKILQDLEKIQESGDYFEG